MKQVVRKIANYAADLAGVNSALYELGGLIVMHDASGCNSTYATHDEPRWYDIDSLIYISGLTEYDAVLGNDDKLIDDIVEAAKETNPQFIALFGSPIALIMGTDFKGIAHVIEKETNIPTFGFQTSGMSSYIQGARQAYAQLVETYCQPMEKAKELSINILGMTPLDLWNNQEAMEQFCLRNQLNLVSSWSMNCSLEQIKKATSAHVNLVVSSTGLDAAILMKEKFNIPYVVGIPMGQSLEKEIIQKIHEQKDFVIQSKSEHSSIVLIGEPVYMTSLEYCLRQRGHQDIQVITPLEIYEPFSCTHLEEEDEIEERMNQANIVIADPLYKPLVKDTHFIELPHMGYSGRMFMDDIPECIGKAMDTWLETHGL